MMYTLRGRGGGGGGGKTKMRCYLAWGRGINECSGRPVFFLLKKIGFGP